MERSSATRESWPRNCSMPEISTARRTARPRSLSGTSTTTTTAGTAAQGAGHQHLDSGRVSLTSSPHTASDALDLSTLEVHAPWVVRYESDCYVQFKVSRFDVASVVVSPISSNRARPSPITHTFGSGSREFECGLFKVPAIGMGMSLNIVDHRDRILRVASLWFDSDRDYASVFQ